MSKVEWVADQALGLRRLAGPVQVIAVASGKGGVGKTNVSTNLSLGLAARGRSVLLLDADLGLANVDVLLGLRPAANLADVIAGTRTLEEVIIAGPGGIQVIPAASGIKAMAELSPAQHASLIRAFGELSLPVDALVVDTAAGISDSVVSFSRAANEVVVVVCDDPASMADAYALIKVLSRDHGVNRFRILANMAQTPLVGRQLFARLSAATDRYLDVQLAYFGAIPYDEYLLRAVQMQRAVLEAFPASKSARALKNLALLADKWPRPQGPSGRLEFFVERLIGTGARQP